MRTILLLLVSLHGLAQDTTFPKIDQLLGAYHEIGKFNGTALVARHGQFLLQKGYGYRNEQTRTPNDTGTIFQIASITKTFTSAVVLQLAEMHRLSMSDKLTKWYPSFPNGDKITVENLLTHTSGIFDYTRDDTPTDLHGEARMMAYLAKKPLDFEPGMDWRYSNSGYSVLGFIISKVSGMAYEQAVRRTIFAPLRMQHSGFDFEHLQSPGKATGYSTGDSGRVVAGYSDSSIVFAAGAIYATVGDLYKWHEGLQNNRIVGATLMNKAYTPFRKNYGYGWIIDSVDGQKMVYHSGNIAGFSSVLVRIPADDICIVLLNNQEGTELETIARKILDILYHVPYTVPVRKIPVTLPDSVLARYVGTYEISDIALMAEITLENHGLVVHVRNGPVLPLTAEGTDRFYINEGQAEVQFAPGKIMIIQNDQQHTGKKIK
jgi:CubicO group peptidase (beta-lactamase class C family)